MKAVPSPVPSGALVSAVKHGGSFQLSFSTLHAAGQQLAYPLSLSVITLPRLYVDLWLFGMPAKFPGLCVDAQHSLTVLLIAACFLVAAFLSDAAFLGIHRMLILVLKWNGVTRSGVCAFKFFTDTINSALKEAVLSEVTLSSKG